MTEPQIRLEILEVGPNKVSIEETNYKVTVDQQDQNRVFVALPGIQGPRGEAGSQILSGNVDPNDGLGRDGDYYVNRVTKEFWGPKQNGTWGEGPLYSALVSRLVFTQAVASDTWVIEHILGGRPSVTIVDTSGTTVFGEVTYVSDTQVTVSFTAPFAGEAYLT